MERKHQLGNPEEVKFHEEVGGVEQERNTHSRKASTPMKTPKRKLKKKLALRFRKKKKNTVAKRDHLNLNESLKRRLDEGLNVDLSPSSNGSSTQENDRQIPQFDSTTSSIREELRGILSELNSSSDRSVSWQDSSDTGRSKKVM